MVYKNGNVFIDGKFIKTNIYVENGIIIRISGDDAAKTDELVRIDANDNEGSNVCAENALHVQSVECAESVDCTGKYIIPALVDIHTHGCVGFDFSTASEEEIEKMLEYYAERGIGTVLATTMTNSREVMLRASENVGKCIRNEKEKLSCRKQTKAGTNTDVNPPQTLRKAHLAGVYMEGPFFGEKKKGAHDTRFLTGFDCDLLEEFDKANGGNTKVVAFDPCLAGAEEFVIAYKERFTLSLAHTDCDYELALKMMEAGVNHVTHLFDAMNGFDKRTPGLPGAMLDHDECYAEIICDGIHIHPSVIRTMFKAHGDHMILISDSMAATGLADGEYELGGLKVTAGNGKATLSDGTLAGSVCDLRTMLERAVSFGVPLEQAVAAATINPAKSVGIDDVCGKIAVGRKAEIIIL